MRAMALLSLAGVVACAAVQPGKGEEGFVPLFDGQDLGAWRIPEGDGGHWRVVDGVIDYDARSEAKYDKNLWTDREFGDFVLRIAWRLKPPPPATHEMKEILPDGSYKKDAKGKEIVLRRPGTDSGIFLRGSQKAQVNIWCWPVGSGEVWGYRTDASVPPTIRAGVTPRVNADRPVGDWNDFEITMKGDRLSVVLNGQTVIENARLPGVPARGRLALQHHGGFQNGAYLGASSLVQFRNIRIKELPAAP